jgi:hypothetical protein
MSLEVCKTAHEPGCRDFAKQNLHEIDFFFVFKILWVLNFVFYDQLVNLVGIIFVISKREVATKHFKEDNSQGPEVAEAVVSLIGEDLWGHVVRGTDHCVGVFRIILEDFACSHVNEFDIALFIYHDILWFQIPVDDLVS